MQEHDKSPHSRSVRRCSGLFIAYSFVRRWLAEISKIIWFQDKWIQATNSRYKPPPQTQLSETKRSIKPIEKTISLTS
jgi:hypothetical protein